MGEIITREKARTVVVGYFYFPGYQEMQDGDLVSHIMNNPVPVGISAVTDMVVDISQEQ